MKKLFPLSFALLLLGYNTSAQLHLDWRFSEINSYNGYPVTALVKYGGYYYLSSQSPNSKRTEYIYRLDSNGTAVGQDSLKDFDFIYDRQMVGGTDGSLYVVGNFPPSQYNIRIVKYDSLLNRIWYKVIADSNASSMRTYGLMYSVTDNSVCIVGYKAVYYPPPLMVMKLDMNGNVLWETLTDTMVGISDFGMDHAGNIILAGTSWNINNDYDAAICKFDQNGQLLWFNSIDGPLHGNDVIYDLALGFDNSINCAAFISDTQAIKAFRINETGMLQWVKGLPRAGYPRIVTDLAGSVYILSVATGPPTAECYFQKMDSTGIIMNTDSVNVPGFNGAAGSFIIDLQCDDSANVYFINKAIQGSDKWIIAKVDSSLNTKFAIVLDTVPGRATPSTLLLEPNGFTIAGSIDYYQETRVMHFTENLGVGIISYDYSSESLVWPNPVHDILHYSVNENKIKNAFVIYDIKGLEVYRNPLENSEGTIDLSFLCSGVYFYTSDSFSFQKIIKM